MNDFVGYIDDEGNVFDGTFQYEGQVGPIGPQGIPGYTPQRGVDYWTESDQETIVTEATSLINGKIEEYNDNAAAKTEAFNDNASDKTTTFNSNFTSKMNKFNQNSGEQKADFNANALDKTGDFNSNASDKTDAFDSHVTSKTTDFDSHVDDEFNELTGSFYTKSQTYSKDEVDGLISSTYHYKGSVTDYSYLPSSGQQVGDVYNLENAGGGYNAGDNVAWTGTDWDKLAGTVDLSNYYTKGQVDNIANTKQNVIDNNNKLASDLVDDTNQTNKFVTSEEKTTWNNKSDFSGSYNDLTNKPDLTQYEEKSNKTNELSGNSTQTQYPNAEIVYKWLDSITPSNEVSGETIHVEDSSDLPIKDFAMLGNATQFTTTGKNLLNSEILETGNIDTNTGIDGGGGSYVRTSGYIDVEPSTTYSIQYKTTASSQQIVIYEYDSDKNYIRFYNKNTNTFSKALDSNCYYIRLRFLSTTIGTSRNVTDVQLEKNSSVTSYEPYTGGTPAPNPDYPQDIHVVTGDNTLVVMGENYFDISYARIGYSIDATSGQDVQHQENACGENYIEVLPNKEYTFLANQICTNIRLSEYTSSKTNIQRNVGSSVDRITIITTANTKYIRWSINVDNTTMTLSKLESVNPVIYKGSEHTTQLISLGNLELAKIGDYTDRIFKAVQGNSIYDSLDSTTKASLTVGSWYKQGNIGKVTLNGSENNWSQITTGGFSFFNQDNAYSAKSQTTYATGRIICNRLVENPTGNYVGAGYIWLNNAGTSLRVGGLSPTDYPNVSSFKTWLSTNNLLVYYVLETPTYTEITDTTLIGQLEEILRKTTYKTTTNFFSIVASGNAEGELIVTYRQDIPTLIQNNTNAILSL